ncbi:MAG: DUF6884 domain-containing protein [Athalassotoga sp.]|uniref:DUF6884 domain-containing protein n=1 Tax=Caldisericum exile TaxID=693075 RepID=A0A2J6X9L6_9BACT|nr:MAG: hypothetical protein C0175_00595 [Caldisericum exile]
MSTLCIVPCGKTKIWDKCPEIGPQKAKDVYIGSFATRCREYAELLYPDSWVILSAKHGFLFPDDMVPGSYNVSFNNKKTHPITVDELKKQAKDKKLYGFDEIVALGGRNYTQIVKQVFESNEIIEPLRDCRGIGYMIQRLNNAISSYNSACEQN